MLALRTIPNARSSFSLTQNKTRYAVRCNAKSEDKISDAVTKMKGAYERARQKREDLEESRISLLKNMRDTVKQIVNEEVEYVRGLFTECANATKTEKSKKSEEQQPRPIEPEPEVVDKKENDVFVDKL
jgi:hypothetical protein